MPTPAAASGTRFLRARRIVFGIVLASFVLSFFHRTAPAAIAGEYNVTAALEADRLRVRIELQRNGEGVFSASVGGRLMPLRGRAQVRAAIAGAFAGYRTAALIRLQGIQLWLRRLPVQPRPTDHPEVLQ